MKKATGILAVILMTTMFFSCVPDSIAEDEQLYDQQSEGTHDTAKSIIQNVRT